MPDPAHQRSNVLVWGALGFLGQHLVEALLNEGANVSVLCRPRHLYPSPKWGNGVTWHELDGKQDERTLLAAVSSADLIYNLAGASGAVASNLDPMHSLNANCGVQLAFLRACEDAGHCPHVVFASSWLVYDIRGDQPVNEEHPVAPRSMYGAHKLCIENYLRIFQLRNKITYTVCRISNPYGCDPGKPTKGYKLLNTFVQDALTDTPICLFGEGVQLRDFIYISDLTQAFLLCGLAGARNESFNISSGTSHSLLEAVETIGDIIGRTPVIRKPWPDEYLAAEPGSYIADISKARTRLGFAPAFRLRAGLEKTIQDFRNKAADERALRAGA